MKCEVDELMPRLLPVGDPVCPDELLPNGAPRTPQEYLRRVQLEAASCPEVVVAHIDPKKLKKKQTVNASVAGCCAAPPGFSPSLRWQQQQVCNFSHIRQSINRKRKHWSQQTLDSNVLMPKTMDEGGWKRFCLGENVCLDSVSLRTEPDPAVDYNKMGFPPLLSIVSRLNQSTVLSVMETLINWFEDRDFLPQLGRWLFALLACLEKPLLPEAHSLIRQLARRCALLRSTLDREDDARLPALNLLICLVARYFEQNDLADQQEPTPNRLPV
ncbi:gem-associated protein 2 [Thalassophryne amazonica]|uniref:gem-associated protein 2 n=1 Tax=Thalassophryne amazonica TaxID=390379 RepID=UPI001470BEAE|nr:gem-associated protein 2 [Thalassophryne amazonica]